MAKFCNRTGCKNPLGSHQPKYCSNQCYYEQKKERQRQDYRVKALDWKQWKEMEDKLAFWYKAIKEGFEVTFAKMYKDDFRFGISEGVIERKGKFFQAVGRYAYYINSGADKKVEIIIW